MQRGTTSRQVLAAFCADAQLPSNGGPTAALAAELPGALAVENQLRPTDSPARLRAPHSGPFETSADPFLNPHPLLFRQAGQ